MAFEIKKGVLKKYKEEKDEMVVIVPEQVVAIGQGAFEGCKSITAIELPAGITSIGKGAFYRCRALKSICIPQGVTKILDDTFAYCSSLAEVTLPEGLVSIGGKGYSTGTNRGAFYQCESLRCVTLPVSCTYVSYDAFQSCSEELVIVAPAVPMETGKNLRVKHSYGWGYLHHPELYLESVEQDYQQYVSSQKKYFLEIIFARDLVDCLETYAHMGKITSKNFEKDYLDPAVNASAVQCTAFLLDWKNQNLPFVAE